MRAWVQEHSLDQDQGAAAPAGSGSYWSRTKTGGADVAARGRWATRSSPPTRGEKTETFKRQVGFEGNTPDIDTTWARFAVLAGPRWVLDDIGPAIDRRRVPGTVNVAR